MSVAGNWRHKRHHPERPGAGPQQGGRGGVVDVALDLVPKVVRAVGCGENGVVDMEHEQLPCRDGHVCEIGAGGKDVIKLQSSEVDALKPESLGGGLVLADCAHGVTQVVSRV